MSNEEKNDSAADPPIKDTNPGGPTVADELGHLDDPNAIFYVHNTVRGRHNRTTRAQQPRHGGMKQHIGGEHRLVRGRPLGFTVAKISLHIKELLEKEKAGLIEVKTRDGRRLDLTTGRLIAPGPPVKSTPNIRPDSVAHDINLGGHVMTQFPGDIAVQDEDPNKVPELLKSAGPSPDEDAPAQEVPAPVGEDAPADALHQADAFDIETSPDGAVGDNLEGTGSVPPPGGKKKGRSNR